MLQMNARTNAANLLKQYRLRATPARLSTLDALLSAGRALTHHEVEQALASGGDKLDRVTLYRTLDFLVEQELAHRLSGEDRTWRFSAQAKAGTHSHPHFCCTSCGSTLCLGNLNPAMVVGLPEGYVFQQAELTIRGLCPGCSTAR